MGNIQCNKDFSKFNLAGIISFIAPVIIFLFFNYLILKKGMKKMGIFILFIIFWVLGGILIVSSHAICPNQSPFINLEDLVDNDTANSSDTPAPVTPAPVTDSPVTMAPVTMAPITMAPVTFAPVTMAPV